MLPECSTRCTLCSASGGAVHHRYCILWAMTRSGREPAVRVRGVTKTYRIFATPYQRLRHLMRLPAHFTELQALASVDMEVGAGETVGIVGENGAGKSTLLKIVSGTTTPTSGDVEVQGRVASILELGAGFHPEFTGRDNAILYGALMGLDRDAMESRLGDILAFAELGEMIDNPLKTYSTGMAMRLAFAVATHVDAEVVIIDEALAVGDGYFQKKCVDRLLILKEIGTTILFCSHAMYYISMFCDRAIWLEEGALRMEGPAKDVVEAYEAFLLERGKRKLESGSQMEACLAADGVRAGTITAIRLLDADGNLIEDLDRGQRLILEMNVDAVRTQERFHVGVTVDTLDGKCVFGASSLWDGEPALEGSDRYTVQLEISEVPLAGGTFNLHVFLLDESGLHVHDQVVVPKAFRVNTETWSPALIEIPHSWKKM